MRGSEKKSVVVGAITAGVTGILILCGGLAILQTTKHPRLMTSLLATPEPVVVITTPEDALPVTINILECANARCATTIDDEFMFQNNKIRTLQLRFVGSETEKAMHVLMFETKMRYDITVPVKYTKDRSLCLAGVIESITDKNTWKVFGFGLDTLIGNKVTMKDETHGEASKTLFYCDPKSWDALFSLH